MTTWSRQHHDDVIKWKHFPRYWPFVRGIHRSPVNSPHKGQWRGALMFSLICVWIYGWVNNGEAGDFRRYRAHFDVTVMTATINHSNSESFKKCILHKHVFLEDFEVICVSQIRLNCISMTSVKFGVLFANNNAYMLQYIQDWRDGVVTCNILQ